VAFTEAQGWAQPGDGTSVGGFELIVFCRDVVRTYALPEQGEVMIGRAEDAAVRLDDSSVSRHHAVLRMGAVISVEDLGSRNGTFIHKAVRTGAFRPELATETMNVRQLIGRSAGLVVGDSIMFGAARAVVRRRRKPEVPRLTETGLAGVVTEDPATQNVYEQAARAAKAGISVIVTGETGVGKEVLARAIHAYSPRAQGPFIAVNCAALSESLLEGELFGYEKGAFTGAVQSRRGLFEAANGGTVLLDEIGELPLGIQAKLLRVLEERAVRPLGTNVTRPIDVRFIAATNRDLESAIQNGHFRQDLYFRLDGITLRLPPLRERPVDIDGFVQRFLTMCSQEIDREPMIVPPETMEKLRRYPWPGNVRELRNCIERAVVLCAGEVLNAEYLPAGLQDAGATAFVPSPFPPSANATTKPPPDQDLGSSRPGPTGEQKLLERQRIVEALRLCGGNQTRAARVLGMSRRTLVSRLAEYGIPRPQDGAERPSSSPPPEQSSTEAE
jgi:two-component system, NtrC family, response regulator AtoC